MDWVGLVGDVRALALPHPPYSPSFPPVSLSSPFVYDRNSKCPRLFFVFRACVLSCLLLLDSFFSTGIGSFVCFFVSSHLVLVFSCSFLFLVSFLLPPASDVFRSSPVVGGGDGTSTPKTKWERSDTTQPLIFFTRCLFSSFVVLLFSCFCFFFIANVSRGQLRAPRTILVVESWVLCGGSRGGEGVG